MAKTHKTHRRTRSATQGSRDASLATEHRSKRLVVFAIVVAGFAVYLMLFFRQPSFFGLMTEGGEVVDRFTDLLVLPTLAFSAFEGASLAGILERIPLAVAALVWWGIAGWIGWPAVRIACASQVWVADRDRMACWILLAVLSILAGLSVLSTAVLILGLVGGIAGRVPLVVTIVGLLIASEVLRRWSNATLPQFDQAKTPEDDLPEDHLQPISIGSLWFARLIPVGTVVLAMLYLFGSMLPAWEFDVLEYHLQAPKEAFQSGAIRFNPHNVYANMPLGAEMHSLAGMILAGGELGWWHGGLFGKTIIGGFSILTALLVGAFIALRVGRTAGWSVAGLLLANVGNAHVAMAGLIDMVVGAYLLAMLVVMSLSSGNDVVKQSGEPVTGLRSSAVFLVALFAGAAAACKYPGLLLAVVPAAVWLLFEALRSRDTQQLSASVCGRWLAVFMLGLSATCLPWLAKNWVQTGNPVFPLAYEVFGATDAGADAWDADTAARWKRVHSPQQLAGRGPYSATAFLGSLKQLVLTSPFVSPALLFLGLIGASWIAWDAVLRRRGALWLMTLVWIVAVWFGLTHRIDRFWLPVIPILAVLAATGMHWIARYASVALAAGIALFGLALGLLQVMAGVGPVDTRFLDSLQAVEQQWLEPTDAAAASPLTGWVNQTFDSEDRLLGIGVGKAYPYRILLEYATCFNQPPGRSWLENRAADLQIAALTENGITHLVVDWAEIERYRSPGNYGFADWPERHDFDEMVHNGVIRRMECPFDPQSVEIFEVTEATSTSD